MPFNKGIDKKVAQAIKAWGTTRKKMFGGTCYILNGNMLCGVYKDYLILRLGEDQANKAMESEDVSPFNITGRSMKGWVMVGESGLGGKKLADWLELAKVFVASLPQK